jgi:hypothetical protein
MLDALWGGQAVVTRENGLAWAHSRAGEASARRSYQPYQGLARGSLFITPVPEPTEAELKAVLAAVDRGQPPRRETARDEEDVATAIKEFRAEKAGR